MDVGKQRIITEKRLNHQARDRRLSIKYCSLIIEHGLYILWSHLDFYAMQIMSQRSRIQGLLNISTYVLKILEIRNVFFLYVSIGSIDEITMGWKVSFETMIELKQGLVSVFTDSFITQLLDTHNEYTTVERNFIEVLVRRIKRLLQFIIVK